jgi:hypothetical protein
MIEHRLDSIRYYTFSSLGEFPQLFHAILTRHGGYSDGPWQSLNLGGSVGDHPDRVRKNRHLVFNAFKRAPDSLVDAWQVHGVGVMIAIEPRPEAQPPKQADIILTNHLGLTVLMRFADCVPILLYDPIRQVVGLVHAGWKGTVKKAVKTAVEAMEKEFGSNPGELFAGIGPSIGPDHYQIGNDVAAEVHQSFGESAAQVLLSRNGSLHFDLWAANEILLRQSGVRQIENSQLCTVCSKSDFFSHRAENGNTGRFGVMVGLKND